LQKPVISNPGIRFHYLDGIRGVAAFLVIFYHFKNAFFDSSKNSSAYTYLWQKLDLFFLNADFSVQIFFALSGFVLAYNSFNKEKFLKKQWIKRYYRLVIPVFIASLFYYLFIKTGILSFSSIYSNEWTSRHWQVSYTFPQFVIHFFFHFLLLSDWQFIFGINSSLWTIPIELLWSYILFAHFYLINFIKQVWVKNLFLLLSVLFIIRFTEATGKSYGFLFLGGALMALNYKAIRHFFNQAYRRYFLLALAVLYTVIVEKGWLAESFSLPFRWSFFAALLYLLLALVSVKLQYFFSLPFLQWLGRISFSLYLLHLLIIGSIASWLFTDFSFIRLDGGLLLLLAITILVSLLVANLFSRFVDELLMKLYDKVYNRIILNKKKSIKA